MLLGHGAIGQFGVAEALPGTVVNAGTVDVSMGQAATFSIGTETATGTAVFAVTTAGAPSFSLGTEVATGGANVSPTTAGQITVSLGEETPFGEAFQNLITLSTGTPNFFIWSEVDDSQTVTWTDVEPGSTD
jgi:hypothetical protein|tara:strand:- start:603 stop:998 length:396 start_codon:yes stop_codon:yes gene_type:complete